HSSSLREWHEPCFAGPTLPSPPAEKTPASLTRGTSCVAIPFRGGIAAGARPDHDTDGTPRRSFVNANRPKLHHLNWNLLHTFLVIVEERSITRAADRLLVRQPSVSAALQRLEETLGSQLIQRDSRRFVLTKR